MNDIEVTLHKYGWKRVVGDRDLWVDRHGRRAYTEAALLNVIHGLEKT